MSPDVAPPSTIHDTPDQEQDIPCPMCDYNLRGLIDPRCPECGYTFLWIDLLDPRRRRHPYVFEQHPERNVWSFFKTLLAGLWPAKFWSSLLPSQPSAPGRLRWYALVTLLMPFVGVLAEGLAGTIYVLRTRYASNPGFLPEAISWAWQRSDAIASLLIITLLLPAWALFTYWTLMIFGTSMDMARVNPSHVRRCVIYSLDVCVWYSLVVVAAVLFMPRSNWRSEENIVLAAVWALLAALAVFAYRMCQAYRRYMRFHRPVATVLASQIIVGLTALNALLIFVVSRWR